jgi:hypothetical protein
MNPALGLADCVDRVAKFSGHNLASTVAELKCNFEKLGRDQLAGQMSAAGIDITLLRSASVVKRAAKQIDVVVHALGILVLLPTIIDQDETVESFSLGAGSSQTKRFDLETNRRIAEFTFIEWQGNDNTRLQKIFKDFYRLAEFETPKSKELWLIDDTSVQKYFHSRASVRSATHKHRDVWEAFHLKYPTVETVGEYYRLNASKVGLRLYGGEISSVWNSLT